LAPLFSLTAAEDITGMARGVAFQLVEALGVLERQKVAEEVKGLDQPARATLRKYGVRFGAYHIYLPALLKPAPRALATQLWAIKHESPDAKGVGELLHLAASGRTSIPVDPETPKPLYRTAGYRICGERAVRVDILERLADLIRPALSWREGAPGPKPDGVFDGRGFLITGAMTSLTGASGEDFASILRSLGYRMDRKPKPVEPAATLATVTEAASVPADATADTAPASDAIAAPAESAPADVAPEQNASAVDLPSRSLLPEPELVAPEAAPPVHEPAVAAAEEEAAKSEAATVDVGTDAVAAAEPAPQSATAAAAPEEPAFVDVWRPAGRADRRPHRPRRAQRQTQVADAGAVAATTTAPAEGAVAQAPADAAPAGRGPRRPHERSDRPDRSKEQPQHQQRQDRRERQQRMERQGGRSDRQDRPRRRDRGDSVDRADREQYYAKPFGNRSGGRDNKQPDPNSPFAKLAALKQQLEQSTKDPS
jgi:ATP-dependent RNA helicase SUPV3L1/SUV3